MQDTLTIHRPDPMEHEVLGPFLRQLNEDARSSIVSNIERRQDVIERTILALSPILEGLRDAGAPLKWKDESGVIAEAKSLLNEIDSAMSSDGTRRVWEDVVGNDDSTIQDLFWAFTCEMFSALDRFLPEGQLSSTTPA
jgi:hypothetical protein